MDHTEETFGIRQGLTLFRIYQQMKAAAKEITNLNY